MAQKLNPQENSLYGSPVPLSRQNPPPISALRNPTTSDTGYPIGQMWVNRSTNFVYVLTSVSAGSANWALTTAGTGDIAFIDGDSGQAEPVDGVVVIAGGSNITTSASGDTLTVDLDNEVTLTGPSGQSGLEVTGEDGYLRNIQEFDGGTVVVASVNTSAVADSAAEVLAQVGAATSADAYLHVEIVGEKEYSLGIDNSSPTDDFVISNGASPSAGSQIVSIDGTTFAVNLLGDINLVSAGAFIGVTGGAATDSIGEATLANGAATVANTNILASDKIFLSRSSINGSTALGQLTYAITPATSFTITSVDPTTPANPETNDTSIVQYLIIRELPI